MVASELIHLPGKKEREKKSFGVYKTYLANPSEPEQRPLGDDKCLGRFFFMDLLSQTISVGAASYFNKTKLVAITVTFFLSLSADRSRRGRRGEEPILRNGAPQKSPPPPPLSTLFCNILPSFFFSLQTSFQTAALLQRQICCSSDAHAICFLWS